MLCTILVQSDDFERLLKARSGRDRLFFLCSQQFSHDGLCSLQGDIHKIQEKSNPHCGRKSIAESQSPILVFEKAVTNKVLEEPST